MIKRLFLFFVLFFVTFQTYAITDAELLLSYNKFYAQLEKKIPNDEQRLTFLDAFGKKIQLYKEKQKSQKNKIILDKFLILNYQNYLTLQSKIEKNGNQVTPSYPSFVVQFKNNGISFQELNAYQEFAGGDGVYKMKISKSYPIDESNYIGYLNKRGGVLVRFSNFTYAYVEAYTTEKKVSYQDLEKQFRYKIDMAFPYVLENGVYYAYKYNQYHILNDTYGMYSSELSAKNINPNTTLLVKNTNGTYFIVNSYSKIKLISESIIRNIPDKKLFLNAVLDDNRYYTMDYDELFLSLKQSSEFLTQGLSNPEKIKKIYQYVIDTTSYYTNFRDGNMAQFSGILTYKNNVGVCDGYTKMMYYMLAFAGVSDVEIKTGYAFDSQDFPDFGHAWIRIGDFYYDPTFDDPTGGNQSSNQYKYFQLPKELMYYNRFDGRDIPEYLKSKSLNERKQIALNNLYVLYENFPEYPLMSKIKTKALFGLKPDQKVTIEAIFNSPRAYTVKNNTFTDNLGYTYTISNFTYYTVTDKNLELVLNQNLDMNNIMFFKWYTAENKYEYRIGYNLTFN